MSVAVFVPTNIALVKYWGKRDISLHLPYTDSLSMTLSKLGTETRIMASDSDSFFLNGKEFFVGDGEFDRVFAVLDLFDIPSRPSIRIESRNNFPTAAGLASSASGMAALVFALNHFFGLDLTKKEMSIIARQGSGSASRSLWGGIVRWHKGDVEDGSDSFAEQVFSKDYFPELSMILNVVSSEKKDVSSREAMNRTVETSELYQRWILENDQRVEEAIHAIQKKDFTKLGNIVEQNALFMHETMRDAHPLVDYLKKESWDIIRHVQHLREADVVEGYVTMDAGPQVKILCLERDIPIFKKELSQFDFIDQQFVCGVGDGPRIIT